MLPDRLKRAEGPAEALTHERCPGLRRLCPGDGFFVIADAPAGPADRDGKVGIFCDRIARKPFRGAQGIDWPCSQCSRDHGNTIEQIEGALLQILAGDVFEGLPAGEPLGTIANFNVARNSPDFWIAEVTKKFTDGIRLDGGICVD